MKILFILLISFGFSACNAWTLFGPRTLEDCILENMKGVTSDDAAKQIQFACYTKFSNSEAPKKCKMRELTSQETNKITGNSSVINLGYPYFSGDFYNGNSAVTVDEIVVAFRADNIKPEQEYTLYLSLPISPKSSGTAGSRVQAMPTKNFEWIFKSIKTCSK